MQQYHVKKQARSSAVSFSANRRLPSPVRVIKVNMPQVVSSVATSPMLSRSAVFATSNEALSTPINHYLPSQVRTMNMNMPPPVSSVESPALIASPLGRPSIFAASHGAFSTPVFPTPCTSIGVGEKPMDMFTSGLSENSPTSVASPLSKPNSVGGISSGEPRAIGGNLDATKLTYDYGHRSPPSCGEMVFEPIDRSSPRSKMNVLCSPCSNNDTTGEDTGGNKPPPNLQTFQPFTKSRSGSINNSSYQKKRGDRASTNATSPTSPTPQNLKDNPERLAKVKTEMCRYFELGGIKNCPWGDNCNYAHGKHELKYNYSSLTLMESSGQIVNAKTHLSRPCMTWISTGACPYGRRCPSIHDPSITGPLENPSWLPAASAKTNAQIIVDRFAAHRDSAVHQENPMIVQGIWENCRPSVTRGTKQQQGGDVNDEVGWEDTYALVCNTGVPAFGAWILANTPNTKSIATSSTQASRKLSELQKLCIVSLMRGRDSTEGTEGTMKLHQLHRDYTYAPTHSLHSELCMVLQTRYFLLINDDEIDVASIAAASTANKDNIVKEISHSEYKSRTTPWNSDYHFSRNKVVMATEVAFAPKGEYNANVSIWFDAKPIKLEPSQIKRCRRLKQKNKAQMRKGHRAPHSNGALLCRTSIADFPSRSPDIDPFVPMLPAQDDAMSESLMLAILDHRIDVLLNNKLARWGVDIASRKKQLDSRMQMLRGVYEGMNHFHQKWIWPKREGSEVVDESTLAPPGNIMPYIPSRSYYEGSMCVSVWDSFVDAIGIATGSFASSDPRVVSKTKRSEMCRLNTFQVLDNGMSITTSLTRRMPRIKPTQPDGPDKDTDKENTWKEIVLGMDGKWKKACRLYNDNRVTSPSSIDARNMPLSTIPFVQPQG